MQVSYPAEQPPRNTKKCQVRVLIYCSHRLLCPLAPSNGEVPSGTAICRGVAYSGVEYYGDRRTGHSGGDGDVVVVVMVIAYNPSKTPAAAVTSPLRPHLDRL